MEKSLISPLSLYRRRMKWGDFLSGITHQYSSDWIFYYPCTIYELIQTHITELVRAIPTATNMRSEVRTNAAYSSAKCQLQIPTY